MSEVGGIKNRILSLNYELEAVKKEMPLSNKKAERLEKMLEVHTILLKGTKNEDYIKNLESLKPRIEAELRNVKSKLTARMVDKNLSPTRSRRGVDGDAKSVSDALAQAKQDKLDKGEYGNLWEATKNNIQGNFKKLFALENAKPKTPEKLIDGFNQLADETLNLIDDVGKFNRGFNFVKNDNSMALLEQLKSNYRGIVKKQCDLAEKEYKLLYGQLFDLTKNDSLTLKQKDKTRQNLLEKIEVIKKGLKSVNLSEIPENEQNKVKELLDSMEKRVPFSTSRQVIV